MAIHKSKLASQVPVAIIGLGRMGVRHVQAVQRLGMPVCGLVDTSQEALDRASTEFGIAPSSCFTSSCDMLSSCRPAAVVVATTAPSHAELVLEAASAGVRYILCEKPMSTSLAQADKMIATCHKAGALLGINHQMRFMPLKQYVKTIVDSNELGPLVSILAAGSNFGLAMNASHYFEMFRYITGTPLSKVQAWLEDEFIANPRGAQFEDRSGRLLARNDAGLSMYIDFSAQAGHGLQVVYTFRHGQIVVDELTGDIRISARKPEFRDQPTTRYGLPADISTIQLPPGDAVISTTAVWSGMLAHTSFPDGMTGLHAVSCLVAANFSHEAGGREVRLDDKALARDRTFHWA